MTQALILGTIHREPEQRTSKNGKPFATLTVKSGMGEHVEWWKVTAFDSGLIEAFMELREGDAVSIQGLLQIGVWAPEGREPKPNLSVVAHAILPLREGRAKGVSARKNSPRQDSRGRRENAPASPAGHPADWRARQGRTRSEQAANGGMRHYPGEAHAELSDEIPW